MGKGNNRGFKRLWYATLYSIKGMSAACSAEVAFRLELLLAAVMIPLGLWYAETAVESVLLVGSVLLVLIVELLNSAIEAVVDRIGPEHHELSGRAKDMGSAAVLLSLLVVLLTWGLLLITKWVV